jgi:hypothetical protein
LVWRDVATSATSATSTDSMTASSRRPPTASCPPTAPADAYPSPRPRPRILKIDAMAASPMSRSSRSGVG